MVQAAGATAQRSIYRYYGALWSKDWYSSIVTYPTTTSPSDTDTDETTDTNEQHDMNTVSLPHLFPIIPDVEQQEIDSRIARLDALAHQVHHIHFRLTSVLSALHNPMLPKWSWPQPALAIVLKLRCLASQNQDLIRGPLDKLLAWPDAASSDPELFYSGKLGFETFHRSHDWFGQMGFEKYETVYSFSDACDKSLLRATILVPKGLRDGVRLRVMWVWHGGGFCTGSGNFIPWYSRSSIEYASSQNLIIIAPDYPLGPEANYADICSAIKDFLTWYKHDGSFEPGFSHWTDWLRETAHLHHVNFETDRVIMEGESAGGLAAIIAMFLNAEKGSGLGIRIDGLLLRYPMVKHYARVFPANGKASYMNRLFTQKEVHQHAQKLLHAIDELSKRGLVPTRSRDSAPKSMSAAFLLSMSGTWQRSFQRSHAHHTLHQYGDEHNDTNNTNGSTTTTTAANNPDFMDGIERASHYANITHHALLPPITIYHAHDDQNCPFEDTRLFTDLLIQHYPGTYAEGETIFLEKVKRLEAKLRVATAAVDGGDGNGDEHEAHQSTKTRLDRVSTEHVGHGFDYDLETCQEDFLREAYVRLDGFWRD